MKKIGLLASSLLVSLFLLACQNKDVSKEPTKTTEKAPVTTTKTNSIDGTWQSKIDAKADVIFSIEGQIVSFQKKTDEARVTFSPFYLKKQEKKTNKDKEKDKQQWQFEKNKKNINVTEKHREADVIFIDTNKEIKEQIIKDKDVIPETIKINRDNHTINYSLKPDSVEATQLFKDATLNFDQKNQQLIFIDGNKEATELELIDK